jgi:hypothetical protein
MRTIRNGDDVHYYDLEALISSPEAEVLVAELGSEIVGSGYARLEVSEAYLDHDQHSYLGFMYVVPEHRGKGHQQNDHHGFGSLVSVAGRERNAIGGLYGQRRG